MRSRRRVFLIAPVNDCEATPTETRFEASGEKFWVTARIVDQTHAHGKSRGSRHDHFSFRCEVYLRFADKLFNLA
jgi:hypothetical protein